MFKDSKTFIRNTVVYFIPFVIMTCVAAWFLWQSFLMLEKQNMKMIDSQVDNVMSGIGEGLSLSMDLAGEICSDSALSRKNMEEYGTLTLSGLEKMQLYKSKMEFCSALFICYQSSNIVTETGTCSMRVFVENHMRLSQDGKAEFERLMAGEAGFASGILERDDGSRYLLLLYYYPEAVHIEEKRIGFLVEVEKIDAVLGSLLQNIDSLAIVLWNGQVLSRLNFLTEPETPERLEALYREIAEGGRLPGYTLCSNDTQYGEMTMLTAVNNRVLREEVLREGVKMAGIGLAAFILLSVFLWAYGRYRYQILNDIRKLAVSHHPEVEASAGGSDYDIIRRALEKDLEMLNRKDDDLQDFTQKARKQLTWLLLCSAPPYELEIEQLMESYGMPEGGPYYCVLEFLLEDGDSSISGKSALELDIPDVTMHYITLIEEGVLYIAGVSLENRDSHHEKRLALTGMMREQLKLQGYNCRRVAWGLVYGDIRELHSSQQEALSVIQDKSLWKTGKEIVFFDEKAHITKRVPHMIAEQLEQFREYLLGQDLKNANVILDSLLAQPKDMAEDQGIYVRYKIVSVLLEAASEKGVSDTQIRNMIEFSNLESRSFDAEVRKAIGQTFVQLGEKSPDIEQILAFIDEHHKSPELSLQMVAEHFRISERSISRVMKREIDKTYKEYLNEIRFKKACDLLDQTDWSVQRVANEVGFYDVSGFYKGFKKIVQMTPDEYRNKSSGVD